MCKGVAGMKSNGFQQASQDGGGAPQAPAASGSGGRGKKRFSPRFPRCRRRRVDCSAEGIKKHMNKGTLYLILWLLWMLGGTMYYSYVNHLGVSVGFYQAVNIGYSIGYGWPKEPDVQNWWFSSFYVIMGASFVGVALGFFADKIVEDSQDWFMHMMEKQQHEADIASDKPFWIRARAHVRYNWNLVRAILLWLVWVSIMIVYSMIQVGWSFAAAQYFAVSTCSTGGHMPIPDDSPMWMFGTTGFFAAIGVPLMGVAMASLGSLLMEKRDDIDDMKKTIEADVTAEELLEMQRFGLEDGDGEIDKAEFIILCMVRLGTDPRLVQFISEQFQKLDDDGSNSLSILEITRGRVSCEDLQRLGQSDTYRASRRLSGNLTANKNSTGSLAGARDKKGSAVSLSSIPEATDDPDEENQMIRQGILPPKAEGVAKENVTAEIEIEAIPEEGADDAFEDNDVQRRGSIESFHFHDTFEDGEEDHETDFHESQDGIFF